jgi:hypothetical protein
MPRVIEHLDGDPTIEQAIKETLPAPTCHHCQQPIEYDGQDSYIHLTGYYSCFQAGSWEQATPEGEL